MKAAHSERSVSREGSNGGGEESVGVGPYKEWVGLPTIRVRPLPDPTPGARLCGPVLDSEHKFEHLPDLFCGRATSTYPKGQGEPICDYFEVELFEEGRTLVCIADGCSWGEQPRQAARKATDAYMGYLRDNQRSITDLRDAGRLILRAFQKAHIKILEGHEDLWLAGTTTLCGGLMMELDVDAETMKKLHELRRNMETAPVKMYDIDQFVSTFEKDENSPVAAPPHQKSTHELPSSSSARDPDEDYRWLFVCANVGDCKAFHYSPRTGTLTDITLGNRTNLTDAKDPGGRLGPYLDKGEPDLRNLGLYLVPCHDDDVIILMTDGIHDNLDPQHLGLKPRDLGLDKFETWHEAEKDDPRITESAKNDFRIQYVKYLVPNMSVYGLTEGLGEHCRRITQSSRDFMETNTFQKLPDDYVRYPGKMDHATMVAFRARGLAAEQRMPSTKPIHAIIGNERPRKLACYSMERERLAEITVEPADLVTHLIAKVKTALNGTIAGRPFRLRRGEDGWKQKPSPIVKRQFGLRVFEVFSEAGDFVVVQFGVVPCPSPPATHALA